MKVIGVVIQKGGVGKTTTAVSLSAALAGRGRRVLLVDMDPQAHATISFGLPAARQRPTTYDVMIGEVELCDIVQHTTTAGLDLAPSSYDLAGAEIELADHHGREYILRKQMSTVSDYDYVIIDTPPSMGTLVANAILASTQLIIPLQVEFLPLTGYAYLIKTLNIKELWDILPSNKDEALDIYEIAEKLGWNLSTTRYGLTDLILLGMARRYPVYSQKGSPGKYCIYKYYRIGSWNMPDVDVEIRRAEFRKRIKQNIRML